MEQKPVRNKVAPVIGVLLGVYGFWLGEGGLQLQEILPIAGGIIGCIAIALVSPGKLWQKSLAGVVSLAIFSVTYFFGLQSFDYAFTECEQRGEEVRVLLKEYYGKENNYPARLSQLDGSIPCRRFTRPTLLDYERTTSGYVLSFRDWLVEHTATESDSFMAHK
jgi:hypothetical protein